MWPRSCCALLGGLRLIIYTSGVGGMGDVRLDFRANLGGRDVSSHCHSCLRLYVQRCHAWVVSACVNLGCCQWFRNTCCCFCWVPYAGGRLWRLTVQCVRPQTCWDPKIWPKIAEKYLQKLSLSVSGNLDHFSPTKNVITRLNWPTYCDWMMSLSSVRRAIITRDRR